jgi:hypothetical protein
MKSRVFSSATSFTARPAQDVAGALYTWLAIAFDAGCAAPWLAPPRAPTAAAQLDTSATTADVITRRNAWLAAAVESGDVTTAFTAALAAATTGMGTGVDSIFAKARAAIRETRAS